MLKEDILASIDQNKMKCAFYIKNMNTQEITQYNQNVVVPSASLIKLTIMGEIFRQIKAGKLSLNDMISVKAEDKVEFSILTLLDGKSYTVKDVMTLMIIMSDNTATNVLIDLLGMDAINDFIHSIDLDDTVIKRKMMDFTARVEGRENYTTAADMAKILELIYSGKLVDKESSDIMLDILKNQQDMTMMMLNIPDDTVVAHKTGELENLDHEAAIVYLKNSNYIFTFFVWDAVSNNYARQAIGKASEIAYNYFNK